MEPEIKYLTTSELQRLGIPNWPIWEKEVSTFEWQYDESEQFYLLEGKITLVTAKQQHQITTGQFVTCPKGLKCIWKITEPVKKHYRFI